MAQQTDLKKLEEKFEALFKEETEESFNKWLADKQQNININNMAQQTAQINPIDWLKNRLYKPSNSMELLSAAYVIEQFEQAKEMFKQQIEAAWKRGDGEHDKVADELSKKYYTKIYGNGK